MEKQKGGVRGGERAKAVWRARPLGLKRAEMPTKFQWREEEEEATTSNFEEGDVDFESAISDESSLPIGER